MTADSTDIKFECPHCGQRMLVERSAAGLTADCPKCSNPVTVPSLDRMREAESDARREAEEGRAVGDLDQARAEIARQHALFKKAVEECERLKANATHIQAESKSFQADRQQLKAEVAQARQAAAASDAHVAALTQALAAAQEGNEWRSQTEAEINDLTERLSNTAAHLAACEREIETGKEQHTEALRTLAKTRVDYSRANSEAAGLRSEVDVLQQEFQALTQGLAAAQEQLGDAQLRLNRLTEEHRMAVQERDELREKSGRLEHDLTALEAGRELLQLRAEHQETQRKNATLTAELAEQTAAAQKNHDVLRGIVDRQNGTLAGCHSELRRLRRGRYVMRSIYGLFALGLLVLGYVAFSVFAPHEFAKVFGHSFKFLGH